ncbi:MAG: uncharacterized protein JWP97_436 [Labilithrix sp.]|nr:uncharacterized protein [Labilithrix sp.]
MLLASPRMPPSALPCVAATARAARIALAAVMVSVVALLGGASSARASEADLAAMAAPPVVEFDAWRGLSYGSFLAPKKDFVSADGGIDVVFHFHAGQMAAKQLKESGLSAVFVACGFGLGSGKYAEAFADPNRFDRMLGELVKNVEKATGRTGLHVRHLGLASWSAGFAAVGRILAVDRNYAKVDTVILNDSLHSQYLDPNPKTAAQGADRVDTRMLRNFIRFAKDAAEGKKTMVITHSSIIPPDYASSTEATQALLTSIAVPLVTVDQPGSRSMTLIRRADAGNLHVRGYRGRGPHDHFEHLYLVGEGLQAWVLPRWKREERLVYTLAGEQL